MKAKCRGYEGELISLDAHEIERCTLGEKPIYTILSYDIAIRTDKSGAQINFEYVKPGEFEIIM